MAKFVWKMHGYEFVNVIKLVKEWQDHKLARRDINLYVLFEKFDQEHTTRFESKTQNNVVRCSFIELDFGYWI